MTAAREAARGHGHGRAEAHVGSRRCPTRGSTTDGDVQPAEARARDRSSSPTSPVPGTGAAAQALVDVAAYRNADALVHVVRAFRDEAVPHVSGTVDPARDAQAMEDELILADLGIAERRLERLEKDLKKGRTADLERERDVMERCREALEEATPLRALALHADDRKRLRGFQFLSAKPLLLVINLDEADVPAVGSDVGRGPPNAPACGRPEPHGGGRPAALREDRARDRGPGARRRRRVPRRSRVSPESGLDRVVRASYDLLGYISFFTVGDDECRAWSIPRTDAPRRRRPARSIPTSPADSSAPRSSPTSTWRPGGHGRLPRARRGAARGQGVRRARRRHHQLPVRDVGVPRRRPGRG
jgi:ribosome-binding ATPase